MEVSRDGQITAIFGKGDLFGYDPKAKVLSVSDFINFFHKYWWTFFQLAQRTRTSSCRSSANVRALRLVRPRTWVITVSFSYCDLQYISATTFHQLCKLFPEFTQRFINELSSDFSCNLWELHKPVDERENPNKRKSSQIPSVAGKYGIHVTRNWLFFSIWSSRQERNCFRFLRRWHFESFTRWEWSGNHAAAGRVVRLESRNRNNKVRWRFVFRICARYQREFRAIEVV